MSTTEIIVQLLAGAKITFVVATGAWLVGLVLGAVLATSRGARSRLVRWPVDFITTIFRSLPQLVLLYLLYFGVARYGIGIAAVPAAIIGLGVVEAAYIAEYYRAGVLLVAPGQRDAGHSLGLSPGAIAMRVVFPQVVPFMYPPALNSFIGLLRNATLASALGAPEILYKAQSLIGSTGEILPTIVVVVGLYIAVTLPMAHVALLLERRAERYRVTAE